MSDHNKQPFFYKFLVNPEYRIWRYITLVFIMTVITFWQTVVTYEYRLEEIGNYIYLLGINVLIIYLAGIFINIHILIPRFLITRRYFLYITYSSAIILFTVIFSIVQEYTVYSALNIPHTRSSYINITGLIDIVSTFMMNYICISGLSMPILLKHWLINTEKISQLENKQIHSEVELLKEQVNPTLLSNILTKSATLVKEKPNEASNMLMKLSQILRYQLYDTNRPEVLLNAEIKFLANYLELQKMYNNNFDYKIESKNDTHKTLISPLLFIPFVQVAITNIQRLKNRTFLYLGFIISDNNIIFLLQCNDINLSEETDLSAISHRLELLYKDRYSLMIERSGIKLTLNTND